MELASQIKKHRTALGLSQEALAARLYVSRQSVSNWETGKTYPDLKSLLMLGDVFSVSLDDLVKGDLKTMKQEIDGQERASFQRDSNIYTALFIALVLLPVPLGKLLGWWGLGAYGLLLCAAMYFAFRVETHKKKFDIQTYQEITAFLEGKTLDEIEKAREAGKRPYQKLLLVLGSALLGAAATFFMLWLLK